MDKSFYGTPEYRQKQSELTKRGWQKGQFNKLIKRVGKECAQDKCQKIFYATPSDIQQYCSSRCSAIIANTGRRHSIETKEKIRKAITGKKYPNRKNAFTKNPTYSTCKNPKCGRIFKWQYWRPKNNPIKYCSRKCAILDIGSRPTSHRAARAKAGKRLDINKKDYFFSRWEANFARILNFLEIKWVHQPKTFDIKIQNYTPDFYLPEYDTYVEIKNYLSSYSKLRDQQFRKIYPEEKLVLILKKEYLDLQSLFSQKVKNWEFSDRTKVFTNQYEYDNIQPYKDKFFIIIKLPM